MMRVLSPMLLAALVLPPQDPRPSPEAPTAGETQGEKLTAKEEELARQLLEQLGSPDFEERRSAAQQLEKMGRKVVPLLEKTVAEAEDSEVRWQARRLVRRLSGERAETLDRAPQDAPRPRDRAPRAGEPGDIGDLREQMQRMREEMRRAFGEMKRLHGIDLDLPDFPDVPFAPMPGAMQQGDSTSIQITPDGVRVETKTSKDGKEDKKVYEAPDMESLLRDHPELKGRVRGWSSPRRGVWSFGPNTGGFDFGRVFPDNFRFHVTPDGFFKVEPDRDAKPGRKLEFKGGKLQKDEQGDWAPGADATDAEAGPKLGIYVRDTIPDEVRDYVGLEAGVGLWVESIAPDSLAKKLGLAQGDIVTKINGRTIRSREDVANALQDAKEVKCEFVRKGSAKVAEAKVEAESKSELKKQ